MGCLSHLKLIKVNTQCRAIPLPRSEPSSSWPQGKGYTNTPQWWPSQQKNQTSQERRSFPSQRASGRSTWIVIIFKKVTHKELQGQTLVSLIHLAFTSRLKSKRVMTVHVNGIRLLQMRPGKQKGVGNHQELGLPSQEKAEFRVSVASKFQALSLELMCRVVSMQGRIISMK